MDKKIKRILFFSAHPDDEIGGAGGFIIKTLREGGAAKLVLCIDPSEPRFDKSGKEERETRLSEFSGVARKIGAEHSFLDFAHYPALSYETVLPCVKEIRDFKPDAVLILNSEDYHTEHRMTAAIVKRAVWHAGRGAFPECGAPHKVQMLLEADGDRPLISPNHFEDISSVIEEKKAAFLLYGSQQARKDLVSAFAGLNRFQGVMYKKGEYAEAFHVTEFFYG
jgi:LmbE family N-acetylglucosaminyl deacetylase